MPAKDPISTYRVALQIQGVEEAYFREASGFNSTTEIIEDRHCGPKGVVEIRKLIGAVKWDNITLKRGTTDSMDLWKWRQQVINGDIDGARRDGSVVFYNAKGEEKTRFNFKRGWPAVWKGADFKADENAIAVEELQIAHEGLERAS